jgi:Peptidase family M28/Secretion system C-terminal sorting domain
MKIKLTIIAVIILTNYLNAQSYNPFVDSLMSKVNIDSLVSYVRILSGEDSTNVNDSVVLIRNRESFSGNDLAADYIKAKLESFGLETNDQNYSELGRNIYSIKPGDIYPGKYLIYCAHYDAVTDYCADDNASGAAGVLETARILSNHVFDYSIIYAFWDEEEIGKLGSRYFAQLADSTHMQIQGVLNFEMSGWDENNDWLMDIHTNEISNSVSIADKLMKIDSLYELPLEPIIYNPGTWASDHGSFWEYNFPAIVFSEAYYGGDFNPYYHSNEDRIEHFNLPYFQNITKLGIGGLVHLATEQVALAVEDEEIIPNNLEIINYPNPFNMSTKIYYSIPNSGNVKIELYDNLGQKIVEILNAYKKSGSYKINYSGNNLSTGIHFLIITNGNKINTQKMILLK